MGYILIKMKMKNKPKNVVLNEKNIFTVLKQIRSLFKKQKIEPTQFFLEVCECLKEGKMTSFCSKHIPK